MHTDVMSENVEKIDTRRTDEMPRRQGEGKIFRFKFKVIFLGVLHDVMICHVTSSHVCLMRMMCGNKNESSWLLKW